MEEVAWVTEDSRVRSAKPAAAVAAAQTGKIASTPAEVVQTYSAHHSAAADSPLSTRLVTLECWLLDATYFAEAPRIYWTMARYFAYSSTRIYRLVGHRYLYVGKSDPAICYEIWAAVRRVSRTDRNLVC